MNAIGAEPNDWDKHLKLMADIDLSAFSYDAAVIAPDTNDATLREFDGTPFTGVFDGDGHAISHLTIVSESYLGLFGSLAPYAHVRDLGVLSASVVGTGDAVGILAGRQSGSIMRCYSTGIVKGSSRAGGLVGYNLTLGYNWDQEVHIASCYSTATVSGNDMIAGLVGDNRGFVTNCYSTSTTSGHAGVGGLIGFNNVGYPGGHIENCYSAGLVNGEEKIGGLVGHAKGSVQSSSFWDTEASGQATSGGGVGKTTAQMQTASTFLDAGWDFIDETANGTEDIWWILEGQDYPRLWWELIPEN